MSKWLSHVTTALGSASGSAWAALKKAYRTALAGHPDDYCPEAHYMRGPGPKWRAKNAKASGQR